jgi:hypothetical protein
MPKNFLIKGHLGQTSVEPGRAKLVQCLATRVVGLVVSDMPMRPPNYKYAKGAWSLMGTPGSAVGTREGHFVGC